MKLIRLIITVVALSCTCIGCANHAKIEVPTTTKVSSPCWDERSFNVDIYYSQPEPGFFNSAEQLELKPLSEAKLSVGAVQVLANLPRTLMNQLPTNSSYSENDDADYLLTVELIAHHKRGPTYSEWETLKNFGKSMITLGLGADEYDIIADFNIKYILASSSGESFEKEFIVKDSVDHERSAIEFKNNTSDYAADLLSKHIMLTSSEFLEEASESLNCDNDADHSIPKSNIDG
jgi:hypothetical protein